MLYASEFFKLDFVFMSICRPIFWQLSMCSDGILTNYKFSYQSTEKQVGSSTIYCIDKHFQTEFSQLNQNEFEDCRTETRQYYDEWRQNSIKF